MRNILSLTLLALATSVFAQSSDSSTTASAADTTTTGTPAATDASVASSSGTSVAASTTSAPAPSGGPPPTVSTGDISAGCASFLIQLNSNAEIDACIRPLLTASAAAAEAPAGNASTTALDNFCKSNGCADTTIRSQLAGFGDACQQELTGANPVDLIAQMYDAVYVVNPLRHAICSKDGAQYCLAKIQTAQQAVIDAVGKVKSGGLSGGPKALGLSNGQIVLSQTPNTSVWRAAGIANLFTLPDLPTEALCTPCTVSILNAYSEFGVAHALGAAKSPLVGGQIDIWRAIRSKCDPDFTKAIFDSQTLAAQRTSGAADVHSSVAGLVASLFVVVASTWLAL